MGTAMAPYCSLRHHLSHGKKVSLHLCNTGISSEAGQQNSQASCVVRHNKPSFRYHSIPSKISHPDTMENEKQG